MLINTLDHSINNGKSEGIYKEKGSKFIGYAFLIETIEDFKTELDIIKQKQPNARHFCYAYQIGYDLKIQFRYNDDGEPNNSAGKPIYGQILSHELTNVGIVVVRYFGGVKLGVGGLIKAYKEAAKLAIESNNIITKEVEKKVKIQFNYDKMNEVMNFLKKQKVKIINQVFDDQPTVLFLIPLSKIPFLENFKSSNDLDVIIED